MLYQSALLVATLLVMANAFGTHQFMRFPSGVDRKMDTSSTPPPTTKWFVQLLDHFNYKTAGANGVTPAIWKQRYLINDDQWGKKPMGSCKGPIFFYTGNESPVTDYWYNSGFMTEVLAPTHGAVIIMMEHRYFGESLPFGNQSFSGANIGFLSSEQALSDYALFLTQWKKENNAESCPVIAFGGSYGAMLTTWMRTKYPNVVYGGLAASAVWGFAGSGVSPYAFMDTCANTYSTSHDGCGPRLADGFRTMAAKAKSATGLKEISAAFGLCNELTSEQEALNLIGYVEGGLVNMAMLDYPYDTDYGILLPAWPVNTTCARLLSFSPSEVLRGMGYAIQTYYNVTGKKTCLDPARDQPSFAVGDGWPYLACTEIYLPSAQRGIWYPTQAWNETADIIGCYEEFGVHLQPNWAEIKFSGSHVGFSSNLIFSTGDLDPWSSQGIRKSLSDSIIAIIIPEAGHHLDLRGPHPEDPIYVRRARDEEASIIAGWLEKYRTEELPKFEQ